MRLGAACPAPSRFGWKLVYRDSSPMLQMTTEAEENGWPPLAAGLCGGSIDRFNALARTLTEFVMRTARW
jgi:hypothetical protein